MSTEWERYPFTDGYDELLSQTLTPRQSAEGLYHYLSALEREELRLRQQAADATIINQGITFTVYSQGDNIDRAWPFDIVPRLISAEEWDRVERGLVQRLQALNLFIGDLYGEQRIIKDGIFPGEVLAQSRNFRKECVGMRPVFGVWAHICGSDLVRDRQGAFHILEDNLRVPSGVSYMLENRMVTKRVLPELFARHRVRPVDDYPARLYDTLAELALPQRENPRVVLLTPGIYNSAYFEHVYLAQRMGVELVEGRDLLVGDDDRVYMKTIFGLQGVDVIYRRLDDLFLDPEVFHPDSMLGVPGLMRSWCRGKVILVNAPGAGVADDKVVYAYVPEVIRYYLGEEAILPNVPTWKCLQSGDLSYVLDHLPELVVKPANESGGYGMMIGPKATRAEHAEMAERIRQDPRNYIAQPVVDLSTVPTLTEEGELEPRHVDLRPFILQGKGSYVTAGGLTRVALRKGSLVVNSSQGGGSKDTWIVAKED
ncbi:circularly permuted type 2 ATP-grasp protein [Candidatus Magnetaquicoccus inordinatus]|uniref:circularly permuted type 2 ATP-grasp protein n=1 Tax=Candidatus Magnetaquicoccus inordinatus TaxID=2496818 RepID=UPI00102BF434|nr:circularly permuted type 2 ATP-grasp protein [Candidatus Magnetaquicoccus inordinatus]